MDNKKLVLYYFEDNILDIWHQASKRVIGITFDIIKLDSNKFFENNRLLDIYLVKKEPFLIFYKDQNIVDINSNFKSYSDIINYMITIMTKTNYNKIYCKNIIKRELPKIKIEQ